MLRPRLLPYLLRLSAFAAGFMTWSPMLRAVTVGDTSRGPSAYGETSLAMVDGRPATAWADMGSRTIKYARALDAAGAQWGAPVSVSDSTSFSLHVSLRAVNGRPAICCAHNWDLRYIRALDAAGTQWPAQFKTLRDGSAARLAKMEIINGMPAVLAWDGYNINYYRATDADGTVWVDPVQVAPTIIVGGLALREVQGRPAAAFTHGAPEGGELRYTRAINPNGTAWEPPAVLHSALQTASCSLEIVNGHPAAACLERDGSFVNLIYMRAGTPEGAAWMSPTGVFSTIDPVFSFTRLQASLAMVNGKPAFAIVPSLHYAQADDSLGEAWMPSGSLDTTGEAIHPSLLEVNGGPAVAYVSQVHPPSVKYLRAAPSGGTALWPPELTVHLNGTRLASGTFSSFGPVTMGETGTLRFSISNVGRGAADLHLTNVTLRGESVAEFSIQTPPQSPVPGGSSTEVVVAHSPVTTGIKNITLEVASNTGLGTSPFSIPLIAFTLPALTVDRPDGTQLGDGAVFDFPLTIPGSPADLVFIVRNPGSAEVQEVDLVIDGPDRGEFTVTTPPPSVLAPGAAFTVTVRHSPRTLGPRTAGLHFTSNLPDESNPYDVTLRLRPGIAVDVFAPPGDSFRCVALEPDGRILAGSNGSVAALFPDGSPDPAFFQPALNGPVHCIAVQRDGGILAGGEFTTANGVQRPGLVRLLRDGAVDPDFDARMNTVVTCIGIQPNGRILAGGEFQSGTDPARRNLVRLFPDGTLDAAFSSFSFPDRVTSLNALPGGKWLVTDTFVSVPLSLKLIGPGGLEEPFVLPQISRHLRSLAWRPDGVMLGGYLDSGGAIRLLPDGSRDRPSDLFALTQSLSWSAFAMLANGACLAAGELRSGGDQEPRVRRLAPDGTEEPEFTTMANGDVRALAVEEDGKVILAGTFTEVSNRFRPGLARIAGEPGVSVLSREGHSTVRWMRGGTAPEVSDVSFEMNTPGEPAWSLLGFGSRIPGGWELTGLNLPNVFQIRARARAGGSLTQMTVSFPTTLESWRLQYFDTADNTGPAADDADPDHDGLTNFTEFAFGLDPTDRASNTLPEFKYANDSFTATFTAPQGREDLLYSAEWSATMQPGTWTPIPDSGTGNAHAFTLPTGGKSRVYVRWELALRPE